MDLLVVLPGLRIPDLEIVDCATTVLGKACMAVVGRQGDPAFDHRDAAVRRYRRRLRRNAFAPAVFRRLAGPARQLPERRPRVNGQAVIWLLVTINPCQRVAKLLPAVSRPLSSSLGV